MVSLVGAINNDTPNTISNVKNLDFPKHLPYEVAEYIVVGERFFDFKGRSGLIKILKTYLPDDHWLVTIFKANKYKESLDRLSAFRNYAAHGSSFSIRKALEAIGKTRIGTAGSWLKSQKRTEKLINKLVLIGTEIKADAPY